MGNFDTAVSVVFVQRNYRQSLCNVNEIRGVDYRGVDGGEIPTFCSIV